MYIVCILIDTDGDRIFSGILPVRLLVRLRTVKAAYMHLNYTPHHHYIHGKLNCNFLMNPWQYEQGFVTMTTRMLPQFVNESTLLSW